MSEDTKSPELYSRYAVQSRIRVRSSLRGVAGSLIATVCFAILGWNLKIPLGVATFFLAVAGIEVLNAKANERKARERRTARKPGPGGTEDDSM